MWLVKLILILTVAYVAVVALMYATQTSTLFPTRLATAVGPPLPATVVRLEVATADGEQLTGVHIPSEPIPPPWDGESQTSERLVVLGFGGNAWNAENLATYLHGLYPHADVVAFHYRGYAPSTGKPGTAALLTDAPLVYDHVVEALGARRIVAVGLSIGAGVAAHLAAKRPLVGLILVTPFDSLENLAREHFPWVPVGWLLRHRLSTIDPLRALDIPVALIAAGADTIVPPRRTEPVRQTISTLILDRTIARTDHNDLYQHPDFRAAMIEALARME